MLLLATLTLLVLAALNYYISGRALFHPAVVYSLSWAFGVFLIWLAGDFFYAVSPETILIFIGGAFALSVGAAITSFAPQTAKSKPPGKRFDWIITASIVLILCGIPVGVRWLLQQIAEHPAGNFFGSAAYTMLDEKVQGTFGYTLFANLLTFSNIVALLAFCEREDHKKRWWLAAFLALFLNLLVAGRSGLVVVILCLFCLDWIKNRRIRWKLVI